MKIELAKDLSNIREYVKSLKSTIPFSGFSYEAFKKFPENCMLKIDSLKGGQKKGFKSGNQLYVINTTTYDAQKVSLFGISFIEIADPLNYQSYDRLKTMLFQQVFQSELSEDLIKVIDKYKEHDDFKALFPKENGVYEVVRTRDFNKINELIESKVAREFYLALITLQLAFYQFQLEGNLIYWYDDVNYNYNYNFQHFLDFFFDIKMIDADLPF